MIIMILFIGLLSMRCYSQSSADSAVMQYLRKIKDEPSPTLKITVKKGKTIRSANFFVEPMDSLSNETIALRTFIFGSSASHSRKYFLLQIFLPKGKEDKIIDDEGIEHAITSLLAFIKQFQLADTEKAVLIRALTYAYN
jgi:hypothetical protein